MREAAVKDADQPVGKAAQSLVMGLAAASELIVNPPRAPPWSLGTAGSTSAPSSDDSSLDFHELVRVGLARVPAWGGSTWRSSSNPNLDRSIRERGQARRPAIPATMRSGGGLRRTATTIMSSASQAGVQATSLATTLP